MRIKSGFVVTLVSCALVCASWNAFACGCKAAAKAKLNNKLTVQSAQANPAA